MTDKDSFDKRTALYHTFGCKLNFAETSTVARMLADKGIRRAAPDEKPDVIVVNTCSVTEEADRKCRRAIRSFHRRYPDATIAVTGCYAQLKAEEAASLPGVGVVAGINDKLRLPELIAERLADRNTTSTSPEIPDAASLREFMPSCSRGDRTRYFLKVQDGCDYWCTYCTIPKARGRSRSGTIDQLVGQARQAAAEGGREIVITGVNIGDFGKGRPDNFIDLCRALDEVDGIERYRISSIEPNLLTDEIIDFVAASRRFMPHFHIPLQCGSDEVLRLMRRRYDTALFRARTEHIKRVMPHAFIGVDLIVGARGERPELFRESRDFVDSLPVSQLHVFPYSERPGTRALEIEYAVEPAEKHSRMTEMTAISERKHGEFCRSFTGTVRPVLLEHGHGDDKGVMNGFTDNYIKVEVAAAPELDNRIVDVRLDSPAYDGESIRATIVGIH
mgnify:FL=1